MTKSEELKNKMRSGDWIIVANILNINSKNARMSFLRPGSKRFADIVTGIEKVVENREKLLINKNKLNDISKLIRNRLYPKKNNSF